MSKPTLLNLALDYCREENLDPGELNIADYTVKSTLIETAVVTTPEINYTEKKTVENLQSAAPSDQVLEVEIEAKSVNNVSASPSDFSLIEDLEEGEDVLESSPLNLVSSFYLINFNFFTIFLLLMPNCFTRFCTFR